MWLTPHYFQIQNRIRKSQLLLQQGYSVVFTASEIGFYDQSHFVKSFRKVFGISPLEYIYSLFNKY
ncbi:MAG: AraC family transcriptional regulator [Clostridiales bacterium]|nr:AraC family transcriptional regulator [Clostridiales bacterium]